MKILIISSYLPFPLYSGGQVRLYNIIKGLSKKHEITLICEKRSSQTENDIKEMEKICKKVITVDRKKQWSYSNILKTGFSLNPFLITGHTLSEMQAKIQHELESDRYDLIHIETFYVMQNLPETDIPTVLVEHNIEYLVYKRYADESLLLTKPLLYLDVEKMKIKEKGAWKKASKLVAVSEVEKKIMTRRDAVVIPNGVDTEKYQVHGSKLSPRVKEEITILYIGDFSWIQNRMAVKWLLTEIWPRIMSKTNLPKLKLWVVGRKIPDDIKNLGAENVVFDENAPDTVKIYENSDILIAPIRVGGGTSFKILEAMATGVVVVTTDLGIEGIEAKEKVDFLLGNDSWLLADAVIDLVQNCDLRMKIAKNARKLMERKYDWERIVEMLELVYKSVV